MLIKILITVLPVLVTLAVEELKNRNN